MTQSGAIMARFLALHPKLIDLSLDRIADILPRIGSPHERLPPIIHVAGTNGKGSTTAFLRAILEAAGKRVHVYTSPHLVSFHERIRLGRVGGGKLVNEDVLVEAFSRVEAANGGRPITVWEITTAAAFLLYSEHPADVLLLEVGLGGRFDATNVITKPLAGVITPVSMDHMEHLGDTVEKIAFEKAGILKRGAAAILADQNPAAQAVLEAQAARVGAGPVLVGGQDFSAHEEGGRFVYQDIEGLLDLPLPRLAGRHQHTNAATAIATVRTVLRDVGDDAIARGMQSVVWPGRLQRLSGDIAKSLPPGAEVWVDGGHNEDGGRVLAAAMGDLAERSDRELVLIAGMLATKDSVGFFCHFKGLAARVIAVPIPGQAAARSPEDTARQAEAAGLAAEPAPSLSHALRRVAERVTAVPPRVLLTGSLYFVGDVLSYDGSVPE
jgi:dihydrofolate synthase/folylpolyglutamate synthase